MAKRSQSLSAQILKFQSGKLILDEHEIDEIFRSSEIAGRKLVVISMCGAMHCGKSLMLNYFHDHLSWSRKSSSPRLSEPPKRYFDWSNGMKNQRKTVGIYVTRKPVLMNHQGEKFAVFFMDSEGLNTTTRAEWQQYLLFHLTTLLSSMQIINVPFISAYEDLKDCVEKELFESRLIILVRDCAGTLACSFGEDEGAEKLLSKLYPGASRKVTIETLKNAFAAISLFNMPHPGSKAVVKQKQVKHEFKGHLQDLNEVFVKQLEMLMCSILSRDKLVLKTVNGQPLTCSEFADYVEICHEAITKHRAVNGLVKVFAHTKYESLVTKCAYQFKEAVKKATTHVAMTEDEFFDLCKSEESRAAEVFDDDEVSERLIEEKRKYFEKLGQVINEIHEELDVEREIFYKKAQEKNEAAVMKGKNRYTKDFRHMSSNQTDIKVVIACHETAKANALRLFDRAPKSGGEAFISSYKQKLTQEVEEEFQDVVDELLGVRVLYLDPMEFIKSLVEDGKMVSYKGYFYRKDKTNQTTINWRCAVKSCKGRLTTTINAENGDVPARVGGEHLHAPDPMRIEVKKVHARVTEKAINTQEPPRRIIADEIQPLNQEAAWQLLSNRNLAVMINRKRKQFSSSEPAEANDAEVNKTYKSETIGIDGGILEHEACAVNFPKKSLDRTIHVSLCLQAHDNAWPTASYSRKSPIFSLTPSNAQFDSKKPVVTIPCWYVSMSSDEDHDGEIYVMQKCNEQWEPIHRESSQNQFVISCSLAQLFPIALARKRTERLMKTMLYLSDKGNFTAFFFHPDEMEKIRAERKVGRCTAMSQINSLNLKPSDDIALYFSRTCDPGRVMACFKAADIHGIKSVTFLGPTVKPNETRTDMRYQVKVNGESQVSDEFQANLQEPGRPDTSHSPRGPIVYNNTTNGIGGRMDYMTVDATPGTEWQ